MTSPSDKLPKIFSPEFQSLFDPDAQVIFMVGDKFKKKFKKTKYEILSNNKKIKHITSVSQSLKALMTLQKMTSPLFN